MSFERPWGPHEEEMARLNSAVLQLQHDIQQSQSIVTEAAKDLQDVREQARKCQDRVKILRKALEGLRGDATRIISLEEFVKVRDLLAENESLASNYEGQALAAKVKGEVATTQAKSLADQLANVERKLRNHGKVLKFPTTQSQEEAPDDDDT
jgi:chromosome segregation ATPase